MPFDTFTNTMTSAMSSTHSVAAFSGAYQQSESNQQQVAAFMNPQWASIAQLSSALRKRKISSVELLEIVIGRAEIASQTINPLAARLYGRARKAAEAADASLARGEGDTLCGIPVSVKDSQYLAGVPCKNGSRTLEDFVPQETCVAIERLEAAGTVVFAKTTCPEFSYVGITESPVYGCTSNPWCLERTTGGSSGGAAAAVAAGLGPMSLGGDGGGSIRIPAAFCGLVGYKPTWNLVPREPCDPTWKSLAVYGPLTRSVDDARRTMEVIAGEHSRERHAAPDADFAQRFRSLKGMRIAVSEDLGFAPLDEDVRRAFRCAITKIEKAGAEIVFDEPGLESTIKTWTITAYADAWVSERVDLAKRRRELGQVTQAVLDFGATFTLAEFLEAQYARERIHQSYVDMWNRTGARVMLTPTLGCAAFPHGRTWPERIGGTAIEPPWVDWAPFLYDANLAGFPSCALPMGLGDEGLPLSLQVIGKRGDDGGVLAAAELIEELLEWPGTYPSLEIEEFGSPARSGELGIADMADVFGKAF